MEHGYCPCPEGPRFVMHFHGTPITPIAKLCEMAGRNFCVSYARPDDVKRCHEIGQSVMLDNGAFTFWRQGVNVDSDWWDGYAKWSDPWLDHPTSWCVIPDVIDGTVEDNDRLIFGWPRHLYAQSAPVWHMHEPLDRLKYLCSAWRKVCVGSSGAYSDPTSSAWAYRMDEAFNALCPTESKPPTWIHMLRAMKQAAEGEWPFASADSTNVAQNHHLHSSPVRISDRWDSRQAPGRWRPREQMALAVEKRSA